MKVAKLLMSAFSAAVFLAKSLFETHKRKAQLSQHQKLACRQAFLNRFSQSCKMALFRDKEMERQMFQNLCGVVITVRNNTKNTVTPIDDLTCL